MYITDFNHVNNIYSQYTAQKTYSMNSNDAVKKLEQINRVNNNNKNKNSEQMMFFTSFKETEEKYEIPEAEKTEYEKNIGTLIDIAA